MSEYYIRSGGQQRGPFSRAQLESQPVSESTLVRQEGTDRWRPASEFPELIGLLRGGLNEQYGSFRDAPDPSPYASPQAVALPVETTGSLAPRWLGMTSCALGVLSSILMIGAIGIMGYAIYGVEGPPAASSGYSLNASRCFCGSFLLMLAGWLIGIIAVAFRGSGKVWALAGLFLCGLPLLLLLGLFLIGVAFG